MQRFYFNIRSEAGVLQDLEGTELPDLEAARREAIEDARQLMSDAVRIGYDIVSRSVEVGNEQARWYFLYPSRKHSVAEIKASFDAGGQPEQFFVFAFRHSIAAASDFNQLFPIQHPHIATGGAYGMETFENM
jgi:hypothetical protein